MALTYLHSDTPFPSVTGAMDDPNGLLAVSHEINADWILKAYRKGIFPWPHSDEYITWWSPTPRMILAIDDLTISRSLRKTIRNWLHTPNEDIRFNHDFKSVINACANTTRQHQQGTWITDAIRSAYISVHERGFAQSVEIYRDNNLIAGLYGVAIGRMFFGESMFTHATDRSKIALVALVSLLKQLNFLWIDCQQETPHLASMGAHPIDREHFCSTVHSLTTHPNVDWATISNNDLRNALARAITITNA